MVPILSRVVKREGGGGGAHHLNALQSSISPSKLKVMPESVLLHRNQIQYWNFTLDFMIHYFSFSLGASKSQNTILDSKTKQIA